MQSNGEYHPHEPFVEFDWDAIEVATRISSRRQWLSDLNELKSSQVDIGSMAISKVITWLWCGGEVKTLVNRAAALCWFIESEVSSMSQADFLRHLSERGIRIHRQRFAQAVVAFRRDFGIRTRNMKGKT